MTTAFAETQFETIAQILGDEPGELLHHSSDCIDAANLHLPGPDFVDRIWLESDRSPRVLGAMAQMMHHGRLSGTGYLSILPVDQGVEHSAGASFSRNPIYFDPDNIVQLAIEGGCNAVASTLGVLGSVARKYAHKIPFILKLNHNELLSCPNQHDQLMVAGVKQAWDMGCVGVGATVYFGSSQSPRQMQEAAEAFAEAHSLGMFTVLWCYLRNSSFKVGDVNHETSADLTGQANHLGVTIQADFVKQKQPTHNGGYVALNSPYEKFGKFDQRIYDQLCSNHPIDLTRYQVVNSYMGRCGLINSGGASGTNDLQQAVRTAVINKRAGGIGLISGRKAFQKPMDEGIELLRSIQDVYLCPEITIA